MTSRITYNSNNVDIRMDKSGHGLNSISNRKINRSGYGNPEVVVLYERIELKFNAFFSETTEDQLWAWWAWAYQGGVFSFAVDSSNTGSTTLDGAPSGAVIPVTSTTGFSIGDKCWIQKQDRTDFEPITIQSISAGVSITADSSLVFSGYASGDTFRHKEYFPSLITQRNSFRPTLTDIRDTSSNFYYKASFHFVEAPA